MKIRKCICSLAIIACSFSLIAQSLNSDPKGMVFIPSGSFEVTVNKEGREIIRTISVDAFWMSQEISNKEYREFLEDIKAHPEYELSWVDFNAMFEAGKLPSDDGAMQEFLKSEKYADLSDKLIDLDKQPFKNYLDSKQYELYPVVGVSQDAANLYCVWKTNSENMKRQAKGLPLVMNYRLPVEAEWEYAVRGVNESRLLTKNYAMPVKSGKKNDWGLYHMLDNVSEWVINYNGFREDVKGAIIKGGSAKKEAKLSDRNIVLPEYSDQWLGFRIVQSYIPPK